MRVGIVRQTARDERPIPWVGFDGSSVAFQIAFAKLGDETMSRFAMAFVTGLFVGKLDGDGTAFRDSFNAGTACVGCWQILGMDGLHDGFTRLI